MAAAPLTDLFLYDLKLLDPERHRAVVGVPLEPILRNLRLLDEAGANLLDPRAAGARVQRRRRQPGGAGDVRRRPPGPARLQLLPYHRLGSDKYSRIGRQNRMPDVEPGEGDVAAAAAYLTTFGIDARRGAEG